jgi:NAD(P)-dependent dehydrogenase (short-subunit alcohol dehydrogenase family)
MAQSELQWAVVTEASSGLGVGLAKGLAARHINLVLVARREAPMRELATELRRRHGVDAGLGGRDIVFRSPAFPFLGRRTDEHGLSDRQSTDASDRAVDSRVVLIGTNDRLQHFWRRTG